MSKFNFRPFSGDKLTHRIIYSYSGGCRISSPASYPTDELAIESALINAEDAIVVEVLRYSEQTDERGLYTTTPIFSKYLPKTL